MDFFFFWHSVNTYHYWVPLISHALFYKYLHTKKNHFLLLNNIYINIFGSLKNNDQAVVQTHDLIKTHILMKIWCLDLFFIVIFHHVTSIFVTVHSIKAREICLHLLMLYRRENWKNGRNSFPYSCEWEINIWIHGFVLTFIERAINNYSCNEGGAVTKKGCQKNVKIL